MTPVAVIAEAWLACTGLTVAWIAVVLHVGKRRDDFDRACQDACDVTADDVDAEYQHLCENGE